MLKTKKIICLTPIYNDWQSFSILIKELEKVATRLENYTIQIVAVNDGSIEESNFKKSNLE